MGGAVELAKQAIFTPGCPEGFEIFSNERARERLGISRAKLETLLEHRALETTKVAPGIHGLKVLVPIGASLDAIYMNWVEAQEDLVDLRALRAHDEVRAATLQSQDGQRPAKVIEAIAALSFAIGRRSYKDLKHISRFHASERESIMTAVEACRGSTFRRSVAKFGSGSVTIDDLLVWLPSELRELRGTCLDAVRGHEFDPPSTRIIQRVAELGRFLPFGFVVALLEMPHARRQRDVMKFMLPLQRVEELMCSRHSDRVWSAEEYGQALADYYEGRSTVADLPTLTVRMETIRLYLQALRSFARRCKRRKGPEKAALEALLPPFPILRENFEAELHALRKDHTAAGHIRRKNRTNQASAEIDDILDARDNRRLVAQRLGNALRAELPSFLAGQTDGFFSVDIDTLDDRGLMTGGRQYEHFRVWLIADAWNSLAEKADYRTKAALRAQLKDHTRDKYVVEHLWTEPIGLASPQTPWMIEIGRAFCFASISSLPVDFAIRRFEAIRKHGLPGCSKSPPGLLTFSANSSALARNAALQGRSFIPLEQLEFAVRFAALACDVGELNWSRPHETQQVALDAIKREDHTLDRVHFTQDVIPKRKFRRTNARTSKKKLIFEQHCVEEMILLTKLQLAWNGHWEFPKMAPDEPLKTKCGPAKYVFSFDLEPLTQQHLNVFLSLLLAGWTIRTLHDLRHVMSEDSAFEDDAATTTQAGLGHAHLICTEDYRELSEAAKELRRQKAIERRMRWLDGV